MSIAQPLPHDSAELHVTGRARYVDDLPVPQGTLHLAFGLSTVAHGEIVSIDLSAVRAAPGVVAVMTAAGKRPAAAARLGHRRSKAPARSRTSKARTPPASSRESSMRGTPSIRTRESL